MLLHVLIQRDATSTRSPSRCRFSRSFMNRQSLLSQFEKLLPLAAKWAAAVEKRILREGVPLSEQGLLDARALGVREPERVRLLALPSVPTPSDLTLKTAVAAIQFLTPATRGLASALRDLREVRLLGRAPTDCSRTGPYGAI